MKILCRPEVSFLESGAEVRGANPWLASEPRGLANIFGSSDFAGLSVQPPELRAIEQDRVIKWALEPGY